MLNLEQQLFKQIEKSKNILIIFPADQGGDATSSALALFLFLKKLGNEVELVSPSSSSSKDNFNFLPEYSQIQNHLNNLRRFIVSVDISGAKVNQIKYQVENDTLNFIISPSEGWFKPEDVSARAGEFKYDLIITVGVSELEVLGNLYDQNVEFFYKTSIINIDNKPSNEDFGQINFIDLNTVAISEMIFYLFKSYKAELITEEISTCLLAGIIQKTKNFKTPNLTPRTLLTSSELISLGANREEIITHLFRSRDINTLKLWGRILNNLRSENNDELIWSKLKLKDFEETKSSQESLSDVVDELMINVPSAKLVAIICENSLSETRVIIYSLKNINALDFMSAFKPQGNSKMASIIIAKDIETASADIIPELKNKLEKIAA
ncbi:MAG: DHH family phosphoesterase [Patescibacteria group bacterium]